MTSAEQVVIAAVDGAEEWAEKQRKKKRSKKVDLLLKEVAMEFEKVKPKIDAVFVQGRLEGFGDKEIGQWIREAMKGKYTDRQIRNVIPESAKDLSKSHDTTKPVFKDSEEIISADEHENTESQNEEPEAVYQMNPDEYRSEDLEQYDKQFLCAIIRYLEKRLGV